MDNKIGSQTPADVSKIDSLATDGLNGVMYISGTNNNDSGISEAMSSRVATGTKVWARAACIGATAKTINVYFGIHEYEG